MRHRAVGSRCETRAWVDLVGSNLVSTSFSRGSCEAYTWRQLDQAKMCIFRFKRLRTHIGRCIGLLSFGLA